MAWQMPLWAANNTDEAEEVDEPPESLPSAPSSPQKFTRTPVRRPSEHTSLLTKAIMGSPNDDDASRPSTVRNSEYPSGLHMGNRRRSMASNISLASTADLTSDTGMTSPARTNTPSPPIPESVVSRLSDMRIQNASKVTVATSNTSAQRSPELEQADAPRKRSIQFSCNNPKPNAAQPATRPGPPPARTTEAEQPAPRRPCIKFACPTRPASTQNTPPRPTTPRASSKPPRKPESPSTPRRYSSLSVGSATPRMTSATRRSSSKPPGNTRPKFLHADSHDLVLDGSQFHEFARDLSREDDWIRQDNAAAKRKLTINDTLVKENHIRRLGREAEEEAELEDPDNVEDDDVDNQDDDDDNDEDDEDEDEDEDDEDEDDDDDDDDDEDEDDDDNDDALSDLSDGYHTDEETGFAESDESEGEDENLVLWTLSKSPAVQASAAMMASSVQLQLGKQKQQPIREQQHSDSSTTTADSTRRRSNMQRVKPQTHEAPDLPDSTDFVCGTLDEDRPLEEAYLTCMAARRNEKLRLIPQDIDPSFPASDPEDEEDEEIYNPVHHDSDDEDFLPGKMEDLHHEQMDRSRRRKKSGLGSPMRKPYHSPPPTRERSPRTTTRHFSPPPAAGGAAAKQIPKQAGKQLRSPPPKPKGKSALPKKSPCPFNMTAKLNLPPRPGGLTATKSLPRAGITFAGNGHHGKHSKGSKRSQKNDVHLRGAIDIVKGLEKKRQRRREKFYQKYCNRARRGQIPERKPQPGRGAERMKELGLLMAGKKDQGNYVMSI